MKPCPSCNKTNAVETGMTGMSFLWGGVIGHKVMQLVQCQECGATYSGKYGWSSGVAALIYTLVMLAVFGTLYFVVFGILLGR